MNLKTVFWYYRGGGLDTFHCLYFKISPNHCLIDCLDSLLQWKAFQKVWCKGRGGEGRGWLWVLQESSALQSPPDIGWYHWCLFIRVATLGEGKCSPFTFLDPTLFAGLANRRKIWKESKRSQVTMLLLTSFASRPLLPPKIEMCSLLNF
jgi:hypothetical protein